MDSGGNNVLPSRDPDFESELPPTRLLDAKDAALLRTEGHGWAGRFRAGLLSPVEPVDRGIILPLDGNSHADRVLFMLSYAGDHVFARCIGTADRGYMSNLIHGIQDPDGGVRFDGEPLFRDGIAREDPRATFIDDKIYLTYTRLDPAEPGVSSVGLAVIQDPARPEEVRELGSLVKINEPDVDCKDSVILMEKVEGKNQILIRLKPGIQVVEFDSMADIEALAADPERRDMFWDAMRRQYHDDPQQFNHLHPNTPEMMLWDARWKPILTERMMTLTEHHPEKDYFDLDFNGPHWYGTGPTPVKVEHEGKKYWLSFHHRGQVIGTLNNDGIRKRQAEGRRLENLKFYCVLSTLHDFDDPRKLAAANPVPLLMPDTETLTTVGSLDPLRTSYGVPFVLITAGSHQTTRDGRPSIILPVGVNDLYTRMKEYPQEKLVEWMLRDGKI